MYEKPKHKVKKIKYQKLTKEAFYKDVETGEVQIVEIADKNGKTRKEERPVKKRVFIDATREEAEKNVDIFEVADPHTGEKHEFSSLEKANKFIRESK